MEPKEKRKDEIYLCKNCHYPLTSSSCIKRNFQNYDDKILSCLLSDNTIDSTIYEHLFITDEEGKSFYNDFCYGIDYNKNKIFCKNDHHIIGFIININEDNIIGIPFIIGFYNKNEIEIKQMEFKTKKQMPIISQYQYTVLAKLKQLRYYVKLLTPTLKESMDLVQIEKRNIYACEDKFDKYKLNLALNKYKELEKKRKNEDKKKEDNKKDDNKKDENKKDDNKKDDNKKDDNEEENNIELDE